ncbi:MAG: hypothetical protein WDM80_01725 [Limisphaerales bacterium]
MKFTTASGQLADEFNPFQADYLAEILEAVAVAWSKMTKPKKRELEDQITFRLAGRLQNDQTFSELPYDIVPQYWLLGINGQRLGRLDLHFKHRQSKRDYFAWESKRLHVTYPGGSFGTEHSIYAGSEGMMAFVEGQYSKNLPAAGMLGYVMNGDTGKAREGLVKRIDERRDLLCLSVDSQLSQSTLAHTVNKGMTGTWLGETLHDLKTHSLRLFHMLLPVT